MKSNKIKTFIGKISYGTKKHSPEIFMAAGITGIVTSVVLACRATLKINSVLESAEKDIKTVKNYVAENDYDDEYTKTDEKKDLTIIYAKTAFKLIRLYAPSAIIGGLSIVGMISSNHILKKRNLALASAYATINNSFNAYRKNVINRFGEETDKELRFGVKEKTVEETEIDPKTGKEKKVKKTVQVYDSNITSEFATYFDANSKSYNGNIDYDMYFLSANQEFANNVLHSRGYLFLNEVYDSIGLPMTKAGQVVGWRDDPNDGESDSYVDFRAKVVYRENKDGKLEEVILIDPNVDGNILEKTDF